MTCDGVLASNQVLLNIVIPLWLVEETDAPRVLLAWLFRPPTPSWRCCFRSPLHAASTPSRGRCGRRTSRPASSSCRAPIVLVTHDTIGWVTIALVWLGHVTVTGAELFLRPFNWGFMSDLTDADQRAEYQGAAHIGGTLGSVWAPALYTWLAMSTGRSAGSRSRSSWRSPRSPWARRPGPPSATSHGTARRPDRPVTGPGVRRRVAAMTAYWITTYKAVHDPDKVAAYATLAGPALPRRVAGSWRAACRR